MNTGVLNISDGNEIQARVVSVDSFTRDKTAATGVQAVTGIGFQPRGVVFFSTDNSQVGQASWGMCGDDLICKASLDETRVTSGEYGNSGSNAIGVRETVPDTYFGQVQSFDPDGFTISWLKAGTPTGTIRVNYIAYK